MYLLTALVIGFVGSAHCLGMCGPLIVAVNPGGMRLPSAVLHHGGRLLVYMSMGAVAGALGSTFSVLGYQQWFSMAIGALMVLTVLLMPVAQRFKRIEALISRVSIKLTGWAHAQGWKGARLKVLMGMANGLLPCGLVYLAVAGAANTFTPWDGALYMAAFGLGTLPALAAVSYLSQRITPHLRSQVRKLIPIAVLLMGALLIVRGMNLGVPYLSPQQAETSVGVTECH